MSAIVFMAGFAAFWWVAGLWSAHFPAFFFVGGPVISVLLVFIARRRLRGAPPRPPEEAKRAGKIVGWAASGEGLAIAVVANLLVMNGQRALVLPAIAIIVGLHFLPLAVLLKVRIYYATAALITLAGVVGLVIDPVHRGLVTGLPVAGLLWLTCVYRLSTEAPKGAPATAVAD